MNTVLTMTRPTGLWPSFKCLDTNALFTITTPAEVSMSKGANALPDESRAPMDSK